MDLDMPGNVNILEVDGMAKAIAYCVVAYIRFKK